MYTIIYSDCKKLTPSKKSALKIISFESFDKILYPLLIKNIATKNKVLKTLSRSSKELKVLEHSSILKLNFSSSFMQLVTKNP